MSNCQHCQEPLENSRRKNCEFCSDIKVKANKNGTYAQVVKAMDKAAADVSLTPAERREIIQVAFSGSTDPRWAAKREAEKREEARREAKKQRDYQNSRLREAGFNWKFFEADRDGIIDEYSQEYDEWVLYAPDGQSISVENAMAIVRGETTLEAVRGQQQEKMNTEYQQAVESFERKLAKLETELDEAKAELAAVSIDETELAKYFVDDERGGRYDINAMARDHASTPDDPLGLNATLNIFFGTEDDNREFWGAAYSLYQAATLRNTVKSIELDLAFQRKHNHPDPADYKVPSIVYTKQMYAPPVRDGMDHYTEEELATKPFRPL